MSPTTQVSSKHIEWNRQGFFALSSDSVTSYETRVQKLQADSIVSRTFTGQEVLRLYYDVNPTWVPICFSKKGLYLWEAGCTWYPDSVEDTPLIQLRPAFEHAPRYLGLYDCQEVIAHEYVHAVRAPLQSELFEEIFSYIISLEFAKGFFGKALRLFRAFFGPLFEKPSEVIFFLVSLSALLLFGMYALSLASYFLIGTFLAVGGLCAFFFIRLLIRWQQWLRCKKHLQELFGKNHLPLMLRLYDEEIVQFSGMPPEKIKQWIDGKVQNNFRWQLLFASYDLKNH